MWMTTPSGVFLTRPAKPTPHGQPNYEGPEADALHPAEHPQSHRGTLARSGGTDNLLRTVDPATAIHFPVLPDGTWRGRP